MPRKLSQLRQERVGHGKFYSGRYCAQTRDLCIDPIPLFFFLVFYGPDWTRDILQ